MKKNAEPRPTEEATMNETRRRSNLWRLPLAAACALLSVFLLGATEARAQWTTPDASGNINSTNTGNVGVGTTTPTGKLDVTTTGTSNGGIDFITKDSVPANSYPFIISHRIGTSSGTLTRLGFNAYAASSTIGLVNTGVGGWIMQSDSRDGLTAPSIQFISVNTSLTKTDVMTLLQGGNVGIGTTTPNRKLELMGDVGGLSFEAASGSPNSGAIRFGDNSGWKFHFGRSRESVGGALNSGTAGALMTIQDNGNVGIGTTSPNQKLSVAGTGAFYNSTPVTPSGVRGLFMGNFSGGSSIWSYNYVSGVGDSLAVSAQDLNLATYVSGNGVSRLFITNGGNVGVGTTTPTQKLDVAGNVNAAGLCLGGTCKTDWSQVGGGSSQWTTSGSNIYFNTGNVGIGTTSPTGKLSVVDGGHLSIYTTQGYGPTFAKDGLTVASNPDVGYSSMVIRSGHSSVADRGLLRLLRYDGISPQQEMLYVRMDGNIGVGTSTPGARLDVGAGATARGSYTDLLIGTGGNNAQMEFYGPTKSSAITHDETVGGLIFYTNGPAFAQSLFLSHAGNLGVGTTNPGSKLFVGSGSAAVSALPGVNVALGGNSYVSASNGTINTFIGSDTSTYGIVGTLSNHPLGLRANNTLAVTVMPSGNVGVGTTNPAAKLDVAGSINASGAITGATVSATYQDVAEWVPSTQKLSAGTVVVLDAGKTNHVVASVSAYDTKVAGVISDSPGVILGTGGEGRLKVATTGRVRVKVDATRGAIHVGDLLVTSEVEGVAMKSVPVDLGGVPIHRPGTIIGKALEPLESGTGEILVLLSLQ
jgi:hypothetical protein